MRHEAKLNTKLLNITKLELWEGKKNQIVIDLKSILKFDAV